MVELRGLCGLATAALCLTGCYSGLTLGESEGGAAAGGTETGAEATDGEGDPDAPALECDAVGAQPLRRISSSQYAYMLRDLLPPQLAAEALAASGFPQTVIDDGFSTYSAANTVSSGESVAIEDNAERIAELFYQGRASYAPALIPCLPDGFSSSDIDACVDGFIEDFGARAFRRPLTEAESAIIGELYAGIRDADGAELALAAVVQYFVQAPAFLYVVEQAGPAGERYVALAPEELATRLALLFTSSGPDAELLEAARGGRLVTREDVEREARRLLDRPDLSRSFSEFHHEWMRGFELDRAEREHPLLTDDARLAAREELVRFAEWFLREADGSLHTLLTTTNFEPDARLEPIYAAGAGELGGETRPGILTTAAAMSAQSHAASTSLVERGAFIREHLLCIPAPAFPGDIDVDATLGGTADLPTARQRLEPLMQNPSCAGCHVGINPLGFPFEVYDWAGAYRATENGTPIDTSTELQLGSLSGQFADADALLAAIAETTEASDCYATHWFRYALGRPESAEDSCSLDEIRAAFAQSGGDIRELLVAIAVSDSFRFRKVAP